MRLNILVIDDSVNHQQSARQVLGAEHNLTVVGTHDEALGLLETKCDEVKFEALRAQYKEQGVENHYERANSESILPYWDAVLCDLLMPAGLNAQGGDGLRYVGQEMPIGWSLAITAALRGAKYVAVVTDMNHHHHPASAMLDSMNHKVFDLQGARALFTNEVRMVGIEGALRICIDCLGEGTKRSGTHTYECCTCRGTKVSYSKEGKDWAKILDQIRNPEANEES